MGRLADNRCVEPQDGALIPASSVQYSFNPAPFISEHRNSDGGTMMTPVFRLALALAVGLTLWGADSRAAPSERRIALVIGNANYEAGALPTPANDAGLVAQTLQAAGFDVTGARDLDQD